MVESHKYIVCVFQLLNSDLDNKRVNKPIFFNKVIIKSN